MARNSKHLNLAVIEARWWDRRNSSVKGMFDVLADIHRDNPHGYHYEMFNDAKAFREIVLRLARTPRIRNLYIAAHGDSDAIYGAGRNKISRVRVANTLDALSKIQSATFAGVYFGCCKIGNERSIQFMLTPLRAARIKVNWIAGYESDVNWVDAAAVDLYFWNLYYGKAAQNKPSERMRIEYVARHMAEFMPGAHEKLRFDIYVRKPGVARPDVKGLIGQWLRPE